MYSCTDFTTGSGGRSPHSASINGSRATTRFACRCNSANNARCFAPPSGSETSLTRTSKGPNSRYSICAHLYSNEHEKATKIPSPADGPRCERRGGHEVHPDAVAESSGVCARQLRASEHLPVAGWSGSFLAWLLVFGLTMRCWLRFPS